MVNIALLAQGDPVSHKSVMVRKVTAFFLFAAILPLPYPYYMLLRAIVFVVFVSLAFKLYKKAQRYDIEMPTWGWVLGVIGILFNPIFPAFLIRELWMVIDLAAGIFLWKTIKWERDLFTHHPSKSI
jgi:hypothetical protein